MQRRTRLFTLLLASAALAAPAAAQESAAPALAAQDQSLRDKVLDLEGAEPSNVPDQLQDPQSAVVTITGNIVEPVPTPPGADFAASLDVTDGFEVAVFADGLENARMIAVAEDGTVYVTRRKQGDVIMLKDEDGDGRADGEPEVVAEKEMMHGIALDGGTAYLVTVEDVYSAPIAEDGTFGELTEIATGLPDGGQHPNRTIAVGPDGLLYVSVGSTCNACAETSDESATMLRMGKDGSNREIVASGLRNTIGFAFQPGTDALYGFDHGIDWLGDDEQPEEFNRIEEGKQYGWPYIYADGQFNPQDYPEEGTMEDWAAASTEPVLLYTPHAAPMQMAFHDGEGLPEEYAGDAFAAMRGSWNRSPPSGYEIVRVRFGEDGTPEAVEPFVTGFLQGEGESFREMGRLAGLAVHADGSLLFTDDENGVLYRVAPSSGTDASTTSSTAN